MASKIFFCNNHCQSNKAKGFNGPPTARPEPGRDQPCKLKVKTQRIKTKDSLFELSIFVHKRGDPLHV